MENCEPLFWYGLIVVALSGVLIIVPNLMGKSSLLTGWNIMLLGLASFTGCGCLEAATVPMRFPGITWFSPTKEEVSWFMATCTVFLVALIGTYYLNPLKKVTSRTLNNWPPQTQPVALWVIGVSLIIILLMPLTLGSVFVGKVMMNLSHKAIIFATVFSFLLWLRQKMNPAWLALFIVTFLAALMLAMLAGATRRLFISVFLGPVVCVYMIYVRTWRPSRAMIAIGLAAVTLISVQFIYNSFRRFGMRTGEERTATNLLHEVRNIDSSWMQRLREDTYRMMAQSNVQYALFTKRHVDNGRLEVKPLNTLAFVATYPIPRAVWLDKPTVIGEVLPHEIVGAERTSWGVNVVGHAAYEGGMWVAGLYGLLAAIGLRFLDDPLARQPTNPFMMAMFTAAAPHIAGWPRGDLGVMTTETAECFLFVVLISVSARILFGTEKSAPVRRSPLPNPRSFQRSVAR
jgi:hypothetical protein